MRLHSQQNQGSEEESAKKQRQTSTFSLAHSREKVLKSKRSRREAKHLFLSTQPGKGAEINTKQQQDAKFSAQHQPANGEKRAAERKSLSIAENEIEIAAR
jgi:hypothetical protein